MANPRMVASQSNKKQ